MRISNSSELNPNLQPVEGKLSLEHLGVRLEGRSEAAGVPGLLSRVNRCEPADAVRPTVKTKSGRANRCVDDTLIVDVSAKSSLLDAMSQVLEQMGNTNHDPYQPAGSRHGKSIDGAGSRDRVVQERLWIRITTDHSVMDDNIVLGQIGFSRVSDAELHAIAQPILRCHLPGGRDVVRRQVHAEDSGGSG